MEGHDEINAALDAEVWDQAKALLRDRLHQGTYDTWLRPTMQLGLPTDTTLRVGCPNEMFSDWLTSQYSEQVGSVLLELGRPNLRVEFVALDRPTADTSDGELIARSGIPRRYETCSRETWLGAWDPRLDDWLSTPADDRTNVLLWGDVGTGKTHLATALLRHHVVKDRRPGLWFSSHRALESFKDEMNGGSTSRSRGLMAQLLSTPLLVLDDLGTEGFDESPWRRERLGLLFEERWNNALPTIVTSNLDPRALMQDTAHLLSRICGGIVVRTKGRDKRLAAAAARRR